MHCESWFGRTIQLTYVVYNPNLRAITLTRATFEMDMTGRVLNTLTITTVPFAMYATFLQKCRGAFEVLTSPHCALTVFASLSIEHLEFQSVHSLLPLQPRFPLGKRHAVPHCANACCCLHAATDNCVGFIVSEVLTVPYCTLLSHCTPLCPMPALLLLQGADS